MRVAVIGGGIAGLAAALRVRDRLGPAADVSVWDKDTVAGGKLSTGAVAGLPAEQGADAFLMRAPGGAGDSPAVALARRLGMELVHPQPLPPGLLVDGALHSLPGGTLLGVPGDLTALGPVAAPDTGADVDDGTPLLADGEDVAVGQLVRQRLGDRVVDRLVDPMLGGVYAGRADTLSLAATMPGLAAACRTATTLTGAVRDALAAAGRPAGAPVFGSVRGGLSRLVETVTAASGARLELGRPVRALARHGRGWRLVAGSTRDPEQVEADAVVLALPARPAARLLSEVSSPAAGDIRELDYASVALVTLALPAGTELPDRSGFLVPATEDTAIKAATFLTRKWPHLRAAGDPELVRASVGRYDEPEPLQLADDALVWRVHGELSAALGGLPEPVAAQVRRWGGALPQYAPGHLERVAAARAALPATLALAGAGYDGVGIPACLASGQAAGDRVADALEESGS